MRLWSLHPSYLTKKQLVALWRDALLAKKILLQKRNRYRFHPQLIRFRTHKKPLDAINKYLEIIYHEGIKQNCAFDARQWEKTARVSKIPVTTGQVEYEYTKLLPERSIQPITCHPLFKISAGEIEAWEKLASNPHVFPYHLNYEKLDFRKTPELYRIGKGEQGVLLVEPYKSEILPYWRFKTAPIAKKSAEKIYSLFLQYKKNKDFVGMDMARKFLQMGYTRSRRYANHSSGKKYVINPQDAISIDEEKKARRNQLPRAADFTHNEKAEAARIFYEYYKKVKEDAFYKKKKEEWMKKIEKV